MILETEAVFTSRVATETQQATNTFCKGFSESPPCKDSLDVVQNNAHLDALDYIIRWQGNHITPPNGFRESDLDHIMDIRGIYVYELLRECPNAMAQMDNRTEIIMITFHDSEEIIMGDLPMINDNPELMRNKNEGEQKARDFLLSCIPEPAKQTLRVISDRYHIRDKQDKEANITKWLDCVQSGRIALDNKLYTTVEDLADRKAHVLKAATIFLQWTNRAIHSFTDELSQQEIQRFSDREIQRYFIHGFGAEITEATKIYNYHPSNNNKYFSKNGIQLLHSLTVQDWV